jgi:hypothetical protein
MIPQGNEEKEAGEEGDDDDADSGAGEELEMKMLRAEKPRRAAAEKASTNFGFLGRVGVAHYKFHKSN